MSHAVIQLETLGCPSCMQKIENAVKALDGVDKDSVKVMFNASRVKVDFNDADVNIEAIENSIVKLGYGVIRSRVKSA
ncbi:MAG TPA: cation transporter [Aliicoccus persicus]|uniref:Cation transporter n=1 Tax=Aliicoccus persicus TaxID=930138 RepID=A0A921DXE4_9STAP|nr:cation transporter [Aliicoccus persicus]